MRTFARNDQPLEARVRTKWERRTRPRGRLDTAYALHYWAKVWVMLLGFAPVLVAMVVGVVNGTATDGLFFPGPDYPAFSTLSSGLVVAALFLLAAAVVSLPLPLEDPNGPSRSDMGWLGALSIVITLVSLVLDDGRPEWLYWAPYAAAAVFALTVVLLIVRGLLSAMHLLPKAWRGSYRATDSI